MSDEARALFAEAQRRHTAGDFAGSVELALRALEIDEAYVEALEHVATALVTRRRRYEEGLRMIERALALRPGDAGLWYSAGWLYEFAAHEMRRRSQAGFRDYYERAAAAFRGCLARDPEGKLQGDAEDLLDHVENELTSL